MKNVMTTTTSTSRATTTEVKITATDKYLTFHDGGKGICKIAKGDAYFSEYDLTTNITKVYKSVYNVNGEIKIDISAPDLVVNRDLYDVMMDFQFDNKNVKIIDSQCEIYRGIGYIGNDTCSVYCGN